VPGNRRSALELKTRHLRHGLIVRAGPREAQVRRWCLGLRPKHILVAVDLGMGESWICLIQSNAARWASLAAGLLASENFLTVMTVLKSAGRATAAM
jgi:hypothetical protein